jgi:hypothetical protein
MPTTTKPSAKSSKKNTTAKAAKAAKATAKKTTITDESMKKLIEAMRRASLVSTTKRKTKTVQKGGEAPVDSSSLPSHSALANTASLVPPFGSSLGGLMDTRFMNTSGGVASALSLNPSVFALGSQTNTNVMTGGVEANHLTYPTPSLSGGGGSSSRKTKKTTTPKKAPAKNKTHRRTKKQ